MRGAWIRAGVLVGGLGAALAMAALAAQAWRQRQEFDRARAEIARGDFPAALLRLDSLSESHPRWVGRDDGTLDYWLGRCRWQLGRRDLALAAFGRVPPDGKYGALVAAFVARGLLAKGMWRAAEERLERALVGGGRPVDEARDELEQIYRMQARFDDAARLLREGCAQAKDPVRVLRALWRTERGTPPFSTIEQALDIGQRLNPDDDRVWLGRARVATFTGRLAEAEALLKRCTAATADEPVWRAWLDWARAARRPDVARNALRSIGSKRLDPVERISWRAWFAQQSCDSVAEQRALEGWLGLEPRSPLVLGRLAALATEAGQSTRADALRAAKAEVDRALYPYDQRLSGSDPVVSASDRLALGRLAEAIGRPFDARVWYTLARQADPENVEAQAALATRNAPPPGAVAADPNDPDPWELPVAAQTDARAGVEAGPPGDATPWFIDQARAAGLAFTYQNGETAIRQMPVALGGGVALLDYDGDGWVDVYAVAGGAFPPGPGESKNGDRLFRNRHDGTFEDVTRRSGLSGLAGGYGHGAAVGDVDNDGRPDLFVARWGSYALYRNRGDGTFEDITISWGLGGHRDWPTSAALADLDGDGDLDLYVCHYVDWNADDPRLCRNLATHGFISCNPLSCTALSDHLFRNDTGRFTDVTVAAGVIDGDGRGLGVVAADFDNDGRIDLFVANDKSANFLFHNLGDFRFEEIGHAAGVAAGALGGYKAGMGVACGDLDGDGLLDLAVTNFYGESTTLYTNLGAGLFADRTASSGLALASRLLLGFGAAFLDVDNDGWLDLLTANGHTDDLGDTPFRMPAQLLLNHGGGRLIDLRDRSGPAIAVPHLGRGLAIGDLDNDGRLDALLVPQNEPLVYLHNQTERAGHWVIFRLEGQRSNRAGIGAQITLRCGGRRQFAARCGGGSYLSASDPRVHFGLGKNRRIDAVEVRWPSGEVDRFGDLEADGIYDLREGDPVAKRFGVRRTLAK
jgi:tetratricopeptide (TPR) repeat protein